MSRCETHDCEWMASKKAERYQSEQSVPQGHMLVAPCELASPAESKSGGKLLGVVNVQMPLFAEAHESEQKSE